MRTLGLKSFALVGVLGALVLAAASTHAWPLENRLMYITFSRSVALPGVELSAGTYAFTMPATDTSLVRVSSKDGKKIYLTAFTYRISRPANLKSGQIITFGEAPRGTPPQVDAWFPDGMSDGRQFIYR